MLLFSFVAPVPLHYQFLLMQRKQIRKAVKRKMLAGMPRDMLVLLKFTEEEKTSRLRWKHSREFEFEGEMYDICDRETRGDTTFYWCYHDREETLLNRKLAALLDFALKRDARRHDKQQQFNNFYSSLFFTEYRENDNFNPYATRHTGEYVQPGYPLVMHLPLLPPPKFHDL